MDFSTIITRTRDYNLHSHTQFCDGRASMEIMARSAVELGMRHYGFSPHSPIPIPSPCNMSDIDVAEYIAEVERIKAIPELQMCTFYTGMEVDYLGPQWGPANAYFKSLPLDYTIGSVHFIPSQSGEYIDIDGKFDRFRERMETCFHGDIEYVVETFYNQSCSMVEEGGFDILGHFDKIGQNASLYAPGFEDSSLYQECVTRLIDKIIEKKCTVELNTKARQQYGRFFPGERYLPILLESGIPILVNSDAHYPDRIDASRDEAFRLLDTIANVAHA